MDENVNIACRSEELSDRLTCKRCLYSGSQTVRGSQHRDRVTKTIHRWPKNIHTILDNSDLPANIKMRLSRHQSMLARLSQIKIPLLLTKQLLLILSLSVLLIFNLGKVSAQTAGFPDTVFVEEFIKDYGKNDSLSVGQLQNFLDSLQKQTSQTDIDEHEKNHRPTVIGEDLVAACNYSTDLWKTNKECLKKQCLNATNLLDLYSLNPDARLTSDDLYKLTTALLYQSHNTDCLTVTATPAKHKKRPASSASWGYGILFVTIINACSLFGALFLPFMKTSIYKQVLMFMVGLAVGSLAASGLLFLIPEAFKLVDDPESDYIWKASTILGGVYLFFLLERLLKFLIQWRKNKKLREAHLSKSPSSDSVATNEDYGICSVQVKTPAATAENAKMRGFEGLNPDVHINGQLCSPPNSPTLLRENSTATELSQMSNSSTAIIANGKDKNGLDHKMSKSEIKEFRQKSEIATVAWMIIFGDGLHNFIDGLSIGAAFTESILAGVSISVAVICEELPHELGDFAILLNAGMSMKKALLFNFLSACMCYFGLIIGILLGQNTTAHDWIFAIAGGMFLYISLVDMLPEMNSAAEEEEKRTGESCHVRVFLIQNAGILIGYSCLLLMAVFGHLIAFE